MKLARSFATGVEFYLAWPEVADAVQRLHEGPLVLPDYRYELAHDALQRTKSRPALREIERALGKFWAFDDRFFGDAPSGGGCGDFCWSAYCAAYLFEDEDLARDLLLVYCPLLGGYAVEMFGTLFARKVCSTFMDDVAHVLWDIQQVAAAREPDFFDWHGNLNDFDEETRASLLAIAGLKPFKHSSYPPKDVMSVFCRNANEQTRTRTYMKDLRSFYREKGYWDIA